MGTRLSPLPGAHPICATTLSTTCRFRPVDVQEFHNPRVPASSDVTRPIVFAVGTNTVIQLGISDLDDGAPGDVVALANVVPAALLTVEPTQLLRTARATPERWTWRKAIGVLPLLGQGERARHLVAQRTARQVVCAAACHSASWPPGTVSGSRSSRGLAGTPRRRDRVRVPERSRPGRGPRGAAQSPASLTGGA